MPRLYRCLPACLLVALSASAAHSAEKTEYTCTSGELVRRIVIEVGDLNTSLPCEVVYWKDQEAPGERRVLWNARSDAAFCQSKAAGLADKLGGAGWNCAGGGDPTVQATTTPAQPAQPSAPAPAPTPAPAPALDAAATAGAATVPSQPVQPAPAPQPTTGQDLQTAAVAPAAPAAAPEIDQLETVIQANLSSLNQSVDGDFKAEIGDFGDLDRDGIDDAVVFFNYESSTADFTQFVAAYLFNGESYHLAATKPVGGTDLAVRKVEVDDIIDGSIQLRLVLNDASQGEDRRAAMVLQDGQLVETE